MQKILSILSNVVLGTISGEQAHAQVAQVISKEPGLAFAPEVNAALAAITVAAEKSYVEVKPIDQTNTERKEEDGSSE